jgi:hypothetical protein
MGLSSKYPYYGPLGSGNYNVSLAFFGPLSEASKSIGLNSSTGLVLPNTDYIQKFAEGDLGISDSFIKNMLFKNMNSPLASKNEEIFKQFAKQNKIDVSDISKFKKGNKFVIPKNQIKIPDEFSMTGFKAFEKTTLQSIFETQKPFMEIVGVAIGSVAKAEDVIARIMPFFGDPLTVKSRKPVGNSGGGSSRPKAIGFKGGAETKEKLQKLNSIQASTVKKDTSNVGGVGGATSSNPNDVTLNVTNQNTNTSGFTSQNWKILSTVYSTGVFDPNVDYSYTYINLPADEPLPEVDPVVIDDTDPYENYKPKSMIFGIYNSKGEAIDPNEYLKTIGLRGNNRTEEVTPFKRAAWILRSPKWKLPQGVIEWPNFGTPNYIWERRLLGVYNTTISKKKPGSDYSIKRYRVGDTNILTGNPAIPNDPLIQSFDAVESETHKKYYNDLVDIGLNATTDLSNEEKVQINQDINGRLDIKSQIEVSFLYGHTKASFYKKVNNKVAFPEDMRKSYKPYQIFVPDAAKDPELSKLAVQRGTKAGMIWIDPEADYDMKVIRVDPVTSIEYLDAVGAPEVRTSIKKFVKNRTKFSFSNGATFSLSISKNNADTQIFEGINDYTFENWNYEDNTIKNGNTYDISVWSDLAPAKFTNNYYQWLVNKPPREILGINGTSTTMQTQPPDRYSITKSNGTWYYSSTADNYVRNGINFLGDTREAVFVEDSKIKRWYYIYDEEYKVTNLPPFGVERSITVNYERSSIDNSDKTIPIWGLKIDDRYSNSKIIDPTQVTNNFLTTADLFIKDDWYGHGAPDDQQNLGIIKRYALTDLDEESYYIVEGILKTENEFDTDDNGKRLNNGRGRGGGGGGWYRLPHAIGAIGVFIRLLIDIGVKLLPKISKLMSLFQNPSKFVTDIMADKLGKNFEFLTPDAISTFQKAGQLKSQIAGQFSGIEDVNKKIDSIRVDASRVAGRILGESSGKSYLEFTQAQKMATDVQKKAEENVKSLQKVVDKKKELANKLRDYYKNSILKNYVYLDETNLNSIFTLDGAATIPLNVLGKKLNFGMAMNMGDVPKKPPLKLIFPNTKGTFKNVQYLIDNVKPSAKNTNQPVETIKEQEITDLKTPVQSQLSSLDKQPPFKNQTINFNEDVNKVQIKFEDGSVTYIPKESVQTFVLTNQNKYNFIYVTEELNQTLFEVDTLLQSGTQEDLDKAGEKLDEAKKNFPNDSVIDDKIKEVESKNNSFAKNLQPLLKSLLGLVTFPIKVVADIIKWMFDFFASLTNPFTLASKMKEFLSFQWILKFFTPTGILDIFGVKFVPLTLIPYAAIAASAKGKFKASAAPVADLSKYISINMIPKLPTYTPDQYKDLLKGAQPLRLLTIFQMMQKFINKVIDFIWSLLGIEALIKAPHIKIVPEDTTNMSPEDIKKVLDGIEPKGATSSSAFPPSDGSFTPNPITGSNTNAVDTLNPAIQGFMYEVKLPDGTTKSFLNRDDLDLFIEQNKDLNYEFTF